MSRPAFQPGIEVLLEQHAAWLHGRVGLLTHPAAVGGRGASSVALLSEALGGRLTALYGPEHGFFGAGLAGERVRTRHHPAWDLPVHSLYGRHRKPTPAMLRPIDTLVVDLQDLATRCYTYVSTLKLALEAAAENGKRVVVADRPVPLSRTLDGPVLDPAFESFVAAIKTPLAYGMTPGEAAQWIKASLQLDVDLRVAPMRGYARDPWRRETWPPWIPPSPGIVSWETACCYPATVFSEAFPALDRGRAAGLPFQVLGAPGLKGRELAERLADCRLPGVAFHVHAYERRDAVLTRLIQGIRLTVTDTDLFQPALTSLCIVTCLQELRGKRIWRTRGARPEWFDKLYGTSAVREAILDGEAPRQIAARWKPGIRAYASTRDAALLYHRP